MLDVSTNFQAQDLRWFVQLLTRIPFVLQDIVASGRNSDARCSSQGDVERNDCRLSRNVCPVVPGLVPHQYERRAQLKSWRCSPCPEVTGLTRRYHVDVRIVWHDCEGFEQNKSDLLWGSGMYRRISSQCRLVCDGVVQRDGFWTMFAETPDKKPNQKKTTKH